MEWQNLLQRNFGPSNIRVNSIAPGVIDTDMNTNLDLKIKKQLEDDYRHHINDEELIDKYLSKLSTLFISETTPNIDSYLYFQSFFKSRSCLATANFTYLQWSLGFSWTSFINWSYNVICHLIRDRLLFQAFLILVLLLMPYLNLIVQLFDLYFVCILSLL